MAEHKRGPSFSLSPASSFPHLLCPLPEVRLQEAFQSVPPQWPRFWFGVWWHALVYSDSPSLWKSYTCLENLITNSFVLCYLGFVFIFSVNMASAHIFSNTNKDLSAVFSRNVPPAPVLLRCAFSITESHLLTYYLNITYPFPLWFPMVQWEESKSPVNLHTATSCRGCFWDAMCRCHLCPFRKEGRRGNGCVVQTPSAFLPRSPPVRW